MPRKPRIHFPGAVYHVMLRGNDGDKIFFQDTDIYRFYLFLQESIEQFGYRIHGFCCMPNHTHLVIQVGKVPLSRIIQNISQRYTRWVNSTRKRTGHLFQGRYKAILVDADSYLLQLVKYVHRNPVRAQMVAHPGDYPWSGHRAFLGQEKLPWLTTDWVLSLFSSNEAFARARYDSFVTEAVDEGTRKEFHCGTCEGRILGDDSFADKALHEAHQERCREFTLADVLTAVCSQYEVSEADLRSPGKSRSTSEARAVTALIVEESRHLSLTSLAVLLNRDLSTLGKSARRIKQRAISDAEIITHIEDIRAAIVEMPKCLV